MYDLHRAYVFVNGNLLDSEQDVLFHRLRIQLSEPGEAQSIHLELTPRCENFADGYVAAHRILAVGLGIPFLGVGACQELRQPDGVVQVARRLDQSHTADVDMSASALLVRPDYPFDDSTQRL